MAHPFEKMFEKALRKSTPEENLVLEEAEALRQKNYSAVEINDVLVHLRDSLIQDKERDIVAEAVEEFDKYL
jgi:hypothetical protein